jgi:hypothetical protein
MARKSPNQAGNPPSRRMLRIAEMSRLMRNEAGCAFVLIASHAPTCEDQPA